MYPEQGSLLVVDDNENNRDMLGRRLERRGYTVTTAGGGQQALDLIATATFDLVLLDIMMPDIDGLHVLTTLRQTYTRIELPIIMVTVRDQSADVVEALELGANDYVTKPIDFPITLARIQTQLAYKRAETALQQSRHAALESARQKAEFLAHMSHEIRTPLNGVLGMSTLLLQMGLTAEQRELADILHTSAEALLPLLNNVLDGAQLEAGKLPLEHVPFDVRATVEGVLDVMAERAFTKHLELVASVQHHVPPIVCGDPGRLRQILLNLVSNAIKFTERGAVVVEVSTVCETATQVQLRFAVRDTGIGIPAAEQQSLFQAFSQAGGASTTRAYGGTGLGLSICKQLAELMGGAIRVDSAPDVGSTFWLTLPYERHTASIPTALRPQLAWRGVQVLVVDEQPTSREAVRHYLTAWGMRSAGAASSAEAVTLLQDQASAGTPYELVLLALSGPDVEASARALTASARVVLMLPLGQPCSEIVQATGALTSLTKPMKYTQLYRCVDDVLTRRVDTPGATGQTAVPCASRPPRPPREVRILVVDDNIVTQHVALHQLQKLGYSAVAVSNCRAMEDALRQTAYDLILIDSQMSRMEEGAAAIVRSRQAGSPRPTPLIAMLATASADEHHLCLAAGMDDSIGKPVKGDDMQTVLARWLPPTDVSAACAVPERQAVRST